MFWILAVVSSLFFSSGVLGDIPVRHGWEISLPLCPPDLVVKARPDAKSFTVKSSGSTYVRLRNPKNRTVDFGGGVRLHQISERGLSLRCHGGGALPQIEEYYSLPLVDAAAATDSLIAELAGFVDAKEETVVRAQIVLSVPGAHRDRISEGSISLILLADSGKGWEKVAGSSLRMPGLWRRFEVLVVEATVPARSRVKLELSFTPEVGKSYDWSSVYLHDARLFGARCYPDFARPEKCLGEK